jgi:hypothetical protein
LKKEDDNTYPAHGFGSISHIMNYRLIYCLRKGLPLDQDVYNAAEWSSIIELTRKFVENNFMAVRVPDFTGGDWKKLEKVTYFE